MRELSYVIGEKRATPDARGNWTPLPAYEGWRPTEPRPVTVHGLGFVLMAAALAAAIASGATP